MKPNKRRYRKITPDVVARFAAAKAIEGNATRAVEVLEPDSKAPANRGHAIATKVQELKGLAYIDSQLEQIGEAAIDRIGEAVQSADERIALKASMFVTDHVRGKAVQRTENKNYNLSIEAVLQ